MVDVNKEFGEGDFKRNMKDLNLNKEVNSDPYSSTHSEMKTINMTVNKGKSQTTKIGKKNLKEAHEQLEQIKINS